MHCSSRAIKTYNEYSKGTANEGLINNNNDRLKAFDPGQPG